MSRDATLKVLNGGKTLSDPSLTPQEWVDRYCEVYGIEYYYKTFSIKEGGVPIDSALLLSRMRLLTHNFGLTGVKSMLPDALAVWKSEQEQDFLSRLCERLKFAPSERDWVSEYVEACTGKRDPLDVAVMRHFCWQVKRKLFGLTVAHHMMPVYYGQSGGGKSVAVHALMIPLSEVSSMRDMTIFNDQFSRRAFSRYFIIFFDEMGKSQQTDINSLKNIITAPSVDYRGMNSEALQSGKQNATFIACSNHPVRERIQDPTSARRFWQINCASKLDWGKVNLIDYEQLWKSVNEQGPCPIEPVLDQIYKVQQSEIRARDLMEEWVERNCSSAPFSEDSPSTEVLYADFRSWCEENGANHFPGAQQFARGIQQRFDRLKLNISSKRTYRGTVWSIALREGREAVS